jgi:hypothetical protein
MDDMSTYITKLGSWVEIPIIGSLVRRGLRHAILLGRVQRPTPEELRAAFEPEIRTMVERAVIDVGADPDKVTIELEDFAWKPTGETEYEYILSGRVRASSQDEAEALVRDRIGRDARADEYHYVHPLNLGLIAALERDSILNR